MSEQEELEKLRRFKSQVHNWLDAMGVPVDPEPEQNAKTGCRLEGRLNFLAKVIQTLRESFFNPLPQVAEFHKLFKHPILDYPQIPDKQRVKLRISLLEEEVGEFADAARAGDIVAVADALCDTQYVLAGAVLEFGLQDKFPALFNEVQRSNMSKACDTREEAEKTIDEYTKMFVETGQIVPPMHYEERFGKFFVYRSDDMKTLKSINYSPAQLSYIVRMKKMHHELQDRRNS